MVKSIGYVDRRKKNICVLYIPAIGGNKDFKYDTIPKILQTIEKPLEMPYQNFLFLRRICLFVYVCSVTKPNFIPRSGVGS